jgi:hypothetical protein
MVGPATSILVGMLIREAVDEIVKEGVNKPGLDNKMCRQSIIDEVYNRLKHLTDDVPKPDFQKDVLDKLY